MSQDPLSRCPQVQPHILPHLPAAPWSPCPPTPTPAATQAARSSQGQRRASARGRAPGQSPLPRTCCHQPGTLHPASLTLCPQHMGHSGSPPRRATCSRSAAVTEKPQLVRGKGLPHTAGREHGPARPQPPRHRGKVCMPARASGCSEGHSGLGPHGQGQQFSVAALAAPGPEGVAVEPCSVQLRLEPALHQAPGRDTWPLRLEQWSCPLGIVTHPRLGGPRKIQHLASLWQVPGWAGPQTWESHTGAAAKGLQEAGWQGGVLGRPSPPSGQNPAASSSRRGGGGGRPPGATGEPLGRRQAGLQCPAPPPRSGLKSGGSSRSGEREAPPTRCVWGTRVGADEQRATENLPNLAYPGAQGAQEKQPGGYFKT